MGSVNAIRFREGKRLWLAPEESSLVAQGGSGGSPEFRALKSNRPGGADVSTRSRIPHRLTIRLPRRRHPRLSKTEKDRSLPSVRR